MDENKPNPGTEALLGELPVDVVCELGRVSMSGREVLELRPGAVIPVGRPLAGPVDLTVGGRVVARGELVDVEGEIGVRVTQMLD
jgi:flagellar motor switch protein FliM